MFGVESGLHFEINDVGLNDRWWEDSKLESKG